MKFRFFAVRTDGMVRFVLWVALFILCWPVALAALVVYPLFWLLSLPFRILGASVSASVDLVLGILLLPIRLSTRLLRAI